MALVILWWALKGIISFICFFKCCFLLEVTNQNYQAPYGYQADPNLYAYQSQTQTASFTNQQSYPTQGDASAAYYSQGYRGYNNDTLSQQYWATQAQNTGGQDNYYPSEQQYQNAAEQGPYYTG